MKVNKYLPLFIIVIVAFATFVDFVEADCTDKAIVYTNIQDAPVTVKSPDMDASKLIRIGESWDVGNGYTFTAIEIDVDGSKAWFDFSRYGDTLDSKVVSEGDTYSYDDIFSATLDTVFAGMNTNLAKINNIYFFSEPYFWETYSGKTSTRSGDLWYWESEKELISKESWTVSYGSVEGYLIPANETKYRVGRSCVEFTGYYEGGYINVTTDISSAAFTISGPKGYSKSGKGTSWSDQNVIGGSYTVTFEDVDEYTTPASQTMSVTPGSAITFNATYLPTTGSIFITTSPSGAEVLLDSVFAGTADPTLTITNVDPGSHTVKCRLSGYSDYETKIHVTAGEVATVDCKLTPAVPILPIVVAFIALIIAVVGIFLWTSSKLQLVLKQTSLPCDGESTLSITVKFVNGFGKKKRQKKDSEVEMETTSGSIQNLVIPAGKDSAEAILTSSNECGPVTVTVKVGKKVTTVDVNFVSENVGIEIDVSPASIPADGKSTATATIRIKDGRDNYISFLDEKTVELTITSGMITSPVNIPARSKAVNATITSGPVSGTATVNASMGPIEGEGKVEFAELAKRYCTHCGAVMAMEAQGCPKCKMIPPSGVDTKQCSTCDAVLPQTAKFCDKCGARQPEVAEPRSPN